MREHEVFPPPNPRLLAQVESADAIVYGMGSLYTSICPSLVLKVWRSGTCTCRHHDLALHICLPVPGAECAGTLHPHLPASFPHHKLAVMQIICTAYRHSLLAVKECPSSPSFLLSSSLRAAGGWHQSQTHMVEAWRLHRICTFCSCCSKVVMRTDEQRAAL